MILALLLLAVTPQCDAEQIYKACERAKALGEFRSVDWSVKQCTIDGVTWCITLNDKQNEQQ